MLLNNAAEIATGSVLTIEVSEIYMPPNLSPFGNIEVFSGDGEYYKIEDASGLILTNTEPGDDAAAVSTSTCTITSPGTGVALTDQTYQFSVYIVGDLPKDSYMTLQIPDEVGMPSGGIADLLFEGDVLISESTVIMSYDSITRTITFNAIVPSESNYIYAPGPVEFSLTGFTNPSTSDPKYFVWKSYSVLNTGAFIIDQIENMYVQAEQGECIVDTLYPTDGNYKIYGKAESWTIRLACEHAVYTTYGVRLTFPTDWFVYDSLSCTVTGQSDSYDCDTVTADGTITIMDLLESDVDKYTWFEFTFNNLLNPAQQNVEYEIQVEILSEIGGVTDLGTYTFDDRLMTYGDFYSFTASPTDLGVGQYPVAYDFTFQPSGDIYEDSYIVLELPDEVQLYNSREIESKCSYNIDGFMSSRLNCAVSGSSLITINTGFQNGPTTEMSNGDSLTPPTFSF